MSTFTHEKLRELAMELREKTIPSGYESVITEWLEQNPIEPVFVGLTDEQVTQFIEKYNIHPLIGVHLKDWQKTQTFAQSEVKEVGLSDEQICELAQYIEQGNSKRLGVLMDVTAKIKNYLTMQTFADTYEDKYNDLYEDYQSLIVDKMLVDKELEQLKSQQFTPNWDGAPCRADEATITLNWYRNGIRIEGKHLFREKRPKPTPQVTVGDIWMHKKTGNKYYIDGFCKTKICDDWCKSVMYHVGDARYTRTLSDFVDKFEQVQP